MSKRILTWIKPTDSQIHLGNYFGAVIPFLKMSEENPDAEIFMFLANMHALTALHDWNAIRQNSINIVKTELIVENFCFFSSLGSDF